VSSAFTSRPTSVLASNGTSVFSFISILILLLQDAVLLINRQGLGVKTDRLSDEPADVEVPCLHVNFNDY
jgi:hypothetical protein